MVDAFRGHGFSLLVIAAGSSAHAPGRFAFGAEKQLLTRRTRHLRFYQLLEMATTIIGWFYL
jgi:hypothetical protein